MKRFIDWLENSFSPRMNRINSNVWIVALKDSIMQVLPFIFLGSIFAMLAILNDFFPGWPDFRAVYSWTLGVISLFVAFLIPFNLMERMHHENQRIIAGLSGLVLFLITISPVLVEAGEPGLKNDALGPGGMFVAIVTGLFCGLVMKLFARFTFFGRDSAIPDFVRRWFDSMLPVGIVVVVGWLVIDVLQFELFRTVQMIFSPLSVIIESPYGFAITMFVLCFIYSMGISTWVLTPVVDPVMYAAMYQNVSAGGDNLVTHSTVFATYLWIGGVGATMPLVLMMLRAKSVRLKALGRASLIPSICNINEPVIFGAVAWNPTLMIPLWLQGLILPLVVWLFTKIIPLGPVPDRQFDFWYIPFPISSWLSTGSLGAVLVALIVFAVSAVIWFPFFRAYDDQLVKKARAEEQAAAAATASGEVRAAPRRTGSVRKINRPRPVAAADAQRGGSPAPNRTPRESDGERP